MDDRRDKLSCLCLFEKALRQRLQVFIDTRACVNKEALTSEVDAIAERKADCGPDDCDDEDERYSAPKGIKRLRERKGHRLSWIQMVEDLADDLWGLQGNDGVRER